MNSPESNGSRKNEPQANCSSCSCELESIPYAWNEICTQKDQTNKSNCDQCKPPIFLIQRP
uniref:Uncharacterized protein MANES_02G061400 n=1 Tax=Rhizophora mucronata TaxID=61149 RepID=A0A2P2KSI7_RHIMU